MKPQNGKQFSTVNLNTAYKPPRAPQGFARPLVGAGRGRGRSLPSGIKAKVSAPEPINLPSKKSEKERIGGEALHGNSGWRNPDKSVEDKQEPPHHQLPRPKPAVPEATQVEKNEEPGPWKTRSAPSVKREKEESAANVPAPKTVVPNVSSADDFPTLGQAPPPQRISTNKENRGQMPDYPLERRSSGYGRDDSVDRQSGSWRKDRSAWDDTQRGHGEGSRAEVPTQRTLASRLSGQSAPVEPKDKVNSEYEWASDENEIDYDRLPSWMADAGLGEEETPKGKDESHNEMPAKIEVPVKTPTAILRTKVPDSQDYKTLPPKIEQTSPRKQGGEYDQEALEQKRKEDERQKARERVIQRELERQKAVERARQKYLELEKKRQEELEQKRQEELEQQRREKEEMERKRKEFEEQRRKQEEELKKKREEELRKKQHEEEKKRLEEERRREEDRKKREEEQQRREEERQREEELERKREEARREERREVERRKKEAEIKRREEQRRENERELARIRQEELEQRKQQEELMRQFAEKKREEIKRKEEARSKQSQLAARAKLEQLERQAQSPPVVQSKQENTETVKPQEPDQTKPGPVEERWRRSDKRSGEHSGFRQGNRQIRPRVKQTYQPKDGEVHSDQSSTQPPASGDHSQTDIKAIPISEPQITLLTKDASHQQATGDTNPPTPEKVWSRKKNGNSKMEQVIEAVPQNQTEPANPIAPSSVPLKTQQGSKQAYQKKGRNLSQHPPDRKHGGKKYPARKKQAKDSASSNTASSTDSPSKQPPAAKSASPTPSAWAPAPPIPVVSLDQIQADQLAAATTPPSDKTEVLPEPTNNPMPQRVHKKRSSARPGSSSLPPTITNPEPSQSVATPSSSVPISPSPSGPAVAIPSTASATTVPDPTPMPLPSTPPTETPMPTTVTAPVVEQHLPHNRTRSEKPQQARSSDRSTTKPFKDVLPNGLPNRHWNRHQADRFYAPRHTTYGLFPTQAPTMPPRVPYPAITPPLLAASVPQGYVPAPVRPPYEVSPALLPYPDSGTKQRKEKQRPRATKPQNTVTKNIEQPATNLPQPIGPQNKPFSQPPGVKRKKQARAGSQRKFGQTTRGQAPNNSSPTSTSGTPTAPGGLVWRRTEKNTTTPQTNLNQVPPEGNSVAS